MAAQQPLNHHYGAVGALGQATTDPTARLFGVKGLVALVTGGGSGIGLMMARALAEAGAHRVYIVGRRVEVLQAAAASIAVPGVVVPLYCDVTSRISLESVASVVENDAGCLNLLVCNAGIAGPKTSEPVPPAGATGTSLEEWRDEQLAVDPDEFTNTFRVNATAVWYAAMAFLKLLDAGNRKGNVEQSSQVVVTSSIAAFNKKAPGGFAYGQSKAAVTHAARQLSVVLPQWGIRVNTLCPGLFPSDMSAAIVQSADDPTPGVAIPLGKDKVPLGRMGDEQDMAGQILYLASKAGSYLNGSINVVDGGRLGLWGGLI